MPVYNVEKYLDRSISSILGQNYTNWELLIVDDESTDNSYRTCKYFQDKDNRIKITSQKNQGSGVARQKALANAKGSYIMFVDPDDYLNDNALNEVNNVITHYYPDLIAFGYKNIFKNKVGKLETQKISYNHNELLELNELKMNYKKFAKVSDKSLWNKVYKKSVIKDNKITFTKQRNGQDAMFNYCFYKYMADIYISTYILYIYDSTRDGSAIKKYSKEKFQNELNIANEFNNLMVTWDIKEKYNKEILKSYWYALFNYLLSLSGSNNNLSLKEKYKLLKDTKNKEVIKRSIDKLLISDLNNFLPKILLFLLKYNMILFSLIFVIIYNKLFLKY